MKSLALSALLTLALSAPADAKRFMYCDPPSPIAKMKIVSAHQSTEQLTQYTLKSGATFVLPVTDNERFSLTVRETDHLQICYGPPFSYKRPAMIGDVESGDYVDTMATPSRGQE